MGIAAEVLTGDPSPDLDLPKTVHLRAGCERRKDSTGGISVAGDLPLFVGDGVNDSGAMVEATAAISMGSGAELARSAAGAFFAGDRIAYLPEAVRLSRAIQQRLRSNLIYAALYNTVGMILAASGNLHPVAAACIMFISSAWVLSRTRLPSKL